MRLFAVLCAAIVASTAACGGDPASATDATTSSTSSTSGGGGAAGEGGAGGASAGFVGGVFAVSDTTDGGSSSREGAFFVRQTGVDHSVTTTTIGPCVHERFGSGAPAHEQDLSAGALHLTGGAMPVDLTPRSDATYAPTSADVALWSGGETLVLAADGADVPAFTTSLVAPSRVTLTTPAGAGSGAPLTVPRAAPFEAAWTGASSGQVVLYFDIATGSAAFAVTCSFDAALGAAEIPADAFADFPAGGGSFTFYVLERATASPGDWTVSFSASSTIVDDAGAPAAGDVVFD